jgi:O-antigen/teichoic acid export membrane protein
MERIRAWLRARDASFFIYAAATVVSAALTFYVVKYVIAFLSKDEYGTWGYYQALAAMLLPMVSLSLPQAMMRMYFDRAADDDAGRAALATTTFLLNAAGTLVLLALAGAAWLAGGRDPVALVLLGGVATGQVGLSFNNYLARMRNDYWVYFANRVAEAAVFMGLAALAAFAPAGGPWRAAPGGWSRLVWLGGAYALLLWGINVANAGWYARRGVLSRRVALLPWAEVRALLVFSLPVTATYFLGWTLASADVWLLKKLSTLAEVADYVFAVGVGSVVSLVSQSALTDWPRFYYAEMQADRPGRDAAIARRVRFYLWLHVAAILGVRLIARFAYRLLGADAYAAGLEYVSYLLLGNFFFLAGNLFAAGIGYAKKTYLGLLTFAVPGLLNVGLNVWLIPLWGARAAALTTLGSYAAFAVVSWAVGRPYYRFTDWRGILAVSGAATVVALVPLSWR